ncbi:MAG: BON domain-containing protein [Hyphomicrobiales bacterium]|nr:BON domain-containing protein [Hyphomicrobiales bacterium]MCP5370387.1 BON domain-containing protein [Hyphomicrobiales bacterium]
MIDKSTSVFPRARRLAAVALAGAVLAGAAAGLGGCAGAVVGGAAATGVAAYQERGISGVTKDLRVALSIREKWGRFDHTMPVKLGVEVYEGRALLTGAVTDEKFASDAVRLAWKAEGVKDVLNEIQITDTGVADYARDSWITTELTTKITLDKDVLAINYAIETVNQVIYLIGIAQDQAELDRVLAHARTIDYVKKIVNHVRVKTRPS